MNTETVEQARPVADISDNRPSRTTASRRMDNAELVASMALEGLRHPILILPTGQLLKGRRRLDAARQLGWSSIPTRTVHCVEDAIEAIHETRNDPDCSVPRSVEEWVTLGLAVESLDHRTKGNNNDFLDLIGAAIARSGSTYKRGRTVVLAARSQRRPMHVVEVARHALAAVNAGTMSITMAHTRVMAATKAVVADNVGNDGLPTLPPPDPAARTPRARKLREEWIRALAAKGATSEQIATHIGITVSGLKTIAREIGLDITADQALARTQRKTADPNRSIRIVVDDLDALVWSLDNIDATGLDPAEVKAWATQLYKHGRSITAISRRIKGVLS